MYFNIKPSKIQNSVIHLGEINGQLKKMQMEVETITQQLRTESNSMFGISEILAIEVSNLDVLLSKFASMEDGLEKAVELYLQCEQRLTGSASEKSLNIKVWWQNVKNWIKNGFWNNPKESDRSEQDEAMVNELKALLQSDKYSKKTWKKSSVEERKQILKDLFDNMQKIYGISAIWIKIEPIKAPEGYIIYGRYRDGLRQISINKDLLNDPKYYKKIMDTMVHEMRHAYQHAVVQNPQSYQVDDKTVDEWSNNFKHYKTIENDGYDAYRDQPIEKDARQFAAWVV